MAFDSKTIEWLEKRSPEFPSPLREHVLALLEELIRVQTQRNRHAQLIMDLTTVLKSRINPECNDPGTIKTAETVLAMIGRGW